MDPFEFKVEIPAATAGTVDDVLLEHGFANWSVFDDVIARRAWVAGVCAGDAEARAEWERLAPLLAAAGVVPIADPAARALSAADWRDSYKAHFHPWKFDRLHWVPVWLRDTYALPAGDSVLWLDPGLAFGTGNHEKIGRAHV